jgi:quinol-cytochrome oxidoreductase complex cytochrome b subunit
MRFLHIKMISTIHDQLIDYPTPVVGFLSSFGSLAGICLTIQLITGVLLVAHYTPHVVYAFSSVEHIMRDVNDGWLLRYIHSNGASIFFLIVYIHILKNSNLTEPDILLWYSGALIYIIIMATAFMGYVLPWGQMSFWGATVITNLFAAIPVVGVDIAQWLWGGFSVDNPTLNRFFSFHYLMPFILAAVVILHLALLHLDESTEDDDAEEDHVSFYPYYYFKDLFALFLLLLVFIFFVYFKPNYFSHPDNYTLASMNVTPSHLVPEWYFLIFYSILRCVPDKFGGLIIMGLTLFITLIDITDLESDEENFDDSIINNFEQNYQTNYVNFLVNGEETNDFPVSYEFIYALITGWLGGQSIEEPYPDIAAMETLMLFFDFSSTLNFLQNSVHSVFYKDTEED